MPETLINNINLILFSVIETIKHCYLEFFDNFFVTFKTSVVVKPYRILYSTDDEVPIVLQVEFAD